MLLLILSQGIPEPLYKSKFSAPRFLFFKNQTLTVALVLGRQSKLIATMKKLFLIVAAMFAVVSFSACSDDDDNKDASIVGTWQITYYEGWATFSDGTRDDWSDAYPLTSEGNYYWTYTFNENGTCVQTDYSDNKNDDSSPMHFTYSVNGNTLTMTESTGEFQNVFQIKKLSQSQLVLFRSGEDAHEKFEETETYKRIK